MTDSDGPNGLYVPRQIFSRAELTGRGMSRHDIASALARSTLTRVHRDSYVVGPRAGRLDEEFAERSIAMSRRLSEGTVLSHVSAAAIHGLPLWGLPTDRVTTTRPRAGHGHQRSRTSITFSASIDDAVAEIDGMPVTTPARTAVDLARAFRLDPSVCVADQALHTGAAAPDELARHVEAAAGFRGIGRARRMLALSSGRAESPLETRSRLTFSRAGLPAPEENVELFDRHGAFLARPDFLWRSWRLIGECDGLGKYLLGGTDEASVRAAISWEKSREQGIGGEGYAMVRWMWSELEQPRAVLQRIREALLRQEAAGYGPEVGRLSD